MTAEQIAEYVDRVQHCDSIPELKAIVREIQPLMSKEPEADELRVMLAVGSRARFLVERSPRATGPNNRR